MKDLHQGLRGNRESCFAGGKKIDDLNVTFENLYKKYKDEDGALYLCISADPPNVGNVDGKMKLNPKTK